MSCWLKKSMVFNFFLFLFSFLTFFSSRLFFPREAFKSRSNRLTLLFNFLVFSLYASNFNSSIFKPRKYYPSFAPVELISITKFGDGLGWPYNEKDSEKIGGNAVWRSSRQRRCRLTLLASKAMHSPFSFLISRRRITHKHCFWPKKGPRQVGLP